MASRRALGMPARTPRRPRWVPFNLAEVTGAVGVCRGNS